MNKTRRQELGALMDRLTAVLEPILEKKEEVESIKTRLDELREEEQDYFDGMPDGLQGGTRGETAANAVSKLEDAVSAIGDLFDALEAFDLSDTLSSIDEARGEA